METPLDTTRQDSKTVRIATSLFIFFCVPTSIWGQSYLMGKIFVAQNPVATATNLLANEFSFRGSILFHLLGTITFVAMMLLFYQVFKPVDKFLSRLMMVSILATIPVVLVFEVFNFTALMILKNEARPTFDVAQQQEVAYLFLRMNRSATGAGIGKLFYGLCFIPFGILIYRSALAPRIIGILVIIGGIGYVADTSIAILLQRPVYVMIRSYLMYTTVAYILALLWFLIMGVRKTTTIANH